MRGQPSNILMLTGMMIRSIFNHQPTLFIRIKITFICPLDQLSSGSQKLDKVESIGPSDSASLIRSSLCLTNRCLYINIQTWERLDIRPCHTTSKSCPNAHFLLSFERISPLIRAECRMLWRKGVLIDNFCLLCVWVFISVFIFWCIIFQEINSS